MSSSKSKSCICSSHSSSSSSGSGRIIHRCVRCNGRGRRGGGVWQGGGG